MEGLRVEFAGEALDVVRLDFIRPEAKLCPAARSSKYRSFMFPPARAPKTRTRPL